ncbi:rhodanese-like domain-containing protein [Maribellus comscasis]|uniref:Rhodanese-like domain-containing protein n=1 Tax=Maribellus comscasis TaxID=2681766 RepID=A0A6I6JXF3_9BACT|nr:rhodanese-like domain-containing protein [Maribellus comscasis]QGY45818.1 rhodanese-like domain-containing protein [Maribellus comscasis]
MKKIIPTFIVFMVSFTLLYAGNRASEKLQEGEGVNKISASQLHEMMEKKDFILVNVHIPYAGEIPKTDILIPYDEIIEHLEKLPAKDQKIVLYCRSDRMSTIASEKLADEGYSNIYNLKGGMKAWKTAGYELINNPPSKTIRSGKK